MLYPIDAPRLLNAVYSSTSLIPTQEDAPPSIVTPPYTQNQNDNSMPSTQLADRDTKQHCIFEEKNKDLLECIYKGTNSEINALLVNHVRDIHKLVQSHKVSFSSSHQQFILSLSNNIPEDMHDEDLDICVDNINTLLNKILFFIQELAKARSSNQKKTKQYVNTATVIQPMWLFKEKKIIKAKSLIDLTEEQITQLINEPNIDNIITKNFIGEGFSIILPSIKENNSKNPNVTSKRKSSTFDNLYHTSNKKKKLDHDGIALKKLEFHKKNKLLLDDHCKKVEELCQRKRISFCKVHKSFISYCYSQNSKLLYYNKVNYLLSEVLDKLFLHITESATQNIVCNTHMFVRPIFNNCTYVHIKSILAIPDELIKDPSFNQRLFKVLKKRKTRTGYPTISEVLAETLP